MNSNVGNDRSAYAYLGEDALADLPNTPRFPPNCGTHGAARETSMPRRPATRRAVASRCAVMPATDCRACARIPAGAVSGVPLSKGGSGAYTM